MQRSEIKLTVSAIKHQCIISFKGDVVRDGIAGWAFVSVVFITSRYAAIDVDCLRAVLWQIALADGSGVALSRTAHTNSLASSAALASGERSAAGPQPPPPGVRTITSSPSFSARVVLPGSECSTPSTS